ncbi:hypothetical protein [Bradyrhizobium sp. 62B]|uniref:hypothetical protein n=1 Tax=Bradyrhizobium sp. 62B TaxID=2898442 RepID=UPI002557E58B
MSSKLGYDANSVRRSIEGLVEAGIVLPENGNFSMAAPWRSVLPEIVTVEAKVGDWPRALNQAVRFEISFSLTGASSRSPPTWPRARRRTKCSDNTESRFSRLKIVTVFASLDTQGAQHQGSGCITTLSRVLPLNISTELAVPFVVDIDNAKADFPDFEFVSALTPSEQKAAFHVRRGGDDLCLKIIAPNHSLDRAQREVATMQEIDHPNVVKLIEYVFSSKGAGDPLHGRGVHPRT